MTKYDYIIFIIIGLIVFFSFLIAFNKIELAIGIAIVGILIGILMYVSSVKSDKQSRMIMMVLLNEKKRKIVEILEFARSINEIISELSDSDINNATINDILDDLEEHGFVKEIVAGQGTKYVRTF